MTRKPLIILILLTFASGGGCGSVEREQPRWQTPAPPPATASGSPPPTTVRTEAGEERATVSTSEPTNRPPKNKFIKWLQNFTPTGGGPGGTPSSAYVSFMQGDCEAVLTYTRPREGEDESEPLEEPLRTLYEGAAAACLAALHGRPSLWRTAVVDAARVDTSGLTCWEQSVYRILDSLVTAYRANEQTRFALGSAVDTGCPELKGTKPNHGPPDGGYTIRLLGRNLPRTLELVWNFEDTVTAHRVSSDTMELTVPRATDDKAEVAINIAGAPRIESVFSSFEYDR